MTEKEIKKSMIEKETKEPMNKIYKKLDDWLKIEKVNWKKCIKKSMI